MEQKSNHRPRSPAGPPPKSRKKSELKAPSPKAAKRRRVVDGLIEGKSQRKAATDAGFSESMADNFKQKILPGLVDEFRDELEKKVPHAILIQRITEGLSAFETKHALFEGKFSDTRNLVSFSERRHYVELTAKLLGYLVQRVEIGGKDSGPLEFNLNVSFVDEDTKDEG